MPDVMVAAVYNEPIPTTSSEQCVQILGMIMFLWGYARMVSIHEKWLCNLIQGLDENVDNETLKRVLENCGRECQTQSMIKKAKKVYKKSEDIDTFLAEFGQTYKHLHRKKDGIYIVYPRCYCSRVNKIPQGKVPAIYCNCSVGWTKALFEGALGRPVDVTLEKSIIAGDSECRFKIHL